MSQPLFKPSALPAGADFQKNADQAFKQIESITQNIDIFKLMVEKAIAQLLADNIGNFVSMLIPKLLGDSDFLGGLSGISFDNISNAINDPLNIEVKQALADFLFAYYGLTPTTPIEPIE